MKKIRLIFSAIVLAAVVLAGSGLAFAQVLEGAWFKLSVSVKGYTVGAGEVISKASFKANSYLYLMWDGGSRHYDCIRYNETGPGIWTSSGVMNGYIDPEFCTEEYIFMPHVYMAAQKPDSTLLGFYITGLITTKLDKFSELKSATFSSLGAEVPIGTAPDGAAIYGGAKVKGKLIDEEKLPFVPVLP